MHAWQQIQQTIDYMETHYEEELDINALADIAHLSKYYYQRLFYRLTGKTVGDYLRCRRLAKASEFIKTSNRTLLDIALSCGFSSHSNFTKQFKETYGITPDEYRKCTIHLDHFNKPDISLCYVLADIEVPLIVDGMVLEISKKTLSKDILLSGSSTIAAIDQLGEPKINHLIRLWDTMKCKENQVGVDILTLDQEPGMFNYFVGVEVKEEDSTHEMRTMPKGDYVVCSYEAENFDVLVNEALYKASRYLYDTWLAKNGLVPDDILVQKYFHPFQENCYIELWAKLK